ncbi:Altered inheritance of mitochondria protein 6 [Fusarium austroafricanum]|uniref:Altered inheritance of mitochondria protein 6 n=1 Tax=Fusarium austroafricanum TaxID=2364996 RepID=A0A8H4P5Z0_9HYPO|nr:Altered inheritance of mitochondria protein 6 [Fusarium austroafricanum]
MKYSTYFYIKSLAGIGEYELLSSRGDDPSEHKRRPSGPRRRCLAFWSIVVCGTILIVAPFFVIVSIILPKALDAYETSRLNLDGRYDRHGNSTYNAAVWSTELSQLVSPVPCHSHNDIWRPIPMFSALAVGCLSIEADVWLSPDGDDVLVGHDKRSLSSHRTLRSLYIDPMVQILNAMNQRLPMEPFNATAQAYGVFAQEPFTTLILHIDVKDNPEKTWPLVIQKLAPLREMGYLSRHDRTMNTKQTFWPGPITVVGTGNIARRRDVNYGADLEEWLQQHDAFLDAPLHLLTETGFIESDGVYRPGALENEFYTASAPLNKAIGNARLGFSKQQLTLLRKQIRIAKQRGLKSRLWGLPSWPISYRDYVWKTLVEEGIDLLNANDINSAAMKHWESIYLRETVWIMVALSYLFLYTVGLVWYTKRLAVQRESLRQAKV